MIGAILDFFGLGAFQWARRIIGGEWFEFAVMDWATGECRYWLRKPDNAPATWQREWGMVVDREEWK